MLTRELAVAHFDWQSGAVHPDRLSRKTHQHYVAIARQMLHIYQQGIGQTRRDLHRQVTRLFECEADCPIRRAEAFCKLLDERSEYDPVAGRRARQLRRRVFRLAAKHHPIVSQADRLFETDREQAHAMIEAELGMAWEQVTQALFADVIEFQRLSRFNGYENAEALLARYNVAQCQAVLYDATQLTIWTGGDFKFLIRAAKLAHLMHRIERLADDRYRIVLDGPASLLRQTQRYGTAMAKFLPSLIACREWKMYAKLQRKSQRRPFHFTLTSRDGLSSSTSPLAAYDSDIERRFAEKWNEVDRAGWQLKREDTILFRGQSVFIPDFSFVHERGRRVLAEIVGFWTPEYLRHKTDVVRKFHDDRFLLIVAHSAAEAIPQYRHCPIVTYKTAIKPAEVLQHLQQIGREPET